MTAFQQGSFFRESFTFCGKIIRGRFLLPSGIRCVRGSVIDRCFDELESVGVITTKSISAQPRRGYREPIYARYSQGSYINAVGLANPGADLFLDELRRILVPPDKFLLVSIFGADEEEFVNAAKILTPVADGFELNMSCPHAKGYGIEIGLDIDRVRRTTAAVAQSVSRPIIVKLSAILPQIGETARAALDAGATGICVSNTIGPSIVYVGRSPILSHRFGGLSGSAIRPLALRAVEAIRDAIGPEPPIIGMGGIGTAEHVLQFRELGADLFGVGSAATGLDTPQLRVFFKSLQSSLVLDQPISFGSDGPDSNVSMEYHPCRVKDRQHRSERLFELTLDRLPGDPRPGQLSGLFYFLCVPGIGEKPFAICSAAERTIVVKEVGPFTEYLAKMPLETELLVRGPYGRLFAGIKDVDQYILVGGGTGTASLLEIGLQLHPQNAVRFLLGARSKAELFATDSLSKLGPVAVATDDGTFGFCGTVSELLANTLEGIPGKERASMGFVNCGPEPMIHACAAIQRMHVQDHQIICAVEYPTSCGVGICGKCASADGHLSCVDGPFMPVTAFEARISRQEHVAPTSK